MTTEDKTKRVEELSEEIRKRQEELHDLTMSESDRAYNSYEVAAENARELWQSYLNILYKEKGAVLEVRHNFRPRIHPSFLNW
jgi:ABC-type sulfate transport system substrate-binding protein